MASFEEMAVLAFTMAATTEVVLVANLALLHHAVPTSSVIGSGLLSLLALLPYQWACGGLTTR